MVCDHTYVLVVLCGACSTWKCANVWNTYAHAHVT